MSHGNDSVQRLLFAPAGEAEAAAFLAGCSRLAGEGRTVRVIQAHSPFAFPPATGGLPRIDRVSQIGAFRGPLEIVLSHENLAGVVELSRSDLLVRAGGGTPLVRIEEAVRAEGLYFPHFDASCRDDVTLAGLLMEGPVPVLAGAYGGLRESVLSARLATGAGEAVHSGSRAVKDVAGYEIIALLIGAGGRYGMIAEATLRLLPGPRTVARAVLTGEGRRLSRIAGEIRARRSSCAAVLAGREASRVMTEVAGAQPPEGDEELLWIEIHAPVEGAGERILGEIAALAGDEAVLVPSAPPFSRLRDALVRQACGGGDDPRRVMHICWDDDGAPAAPEPLGWRDAFPPRSHVLVPLGPGGGAGGEDAGMHPILHRAGNERRLRADLIEVVSGRIRGARVTGDRSVPEGKGAARAADEALKAIEERIARVFDPAGILMP